MNFSTGKTRKRLLSALTASFALFAFAEQAQAQEILLTGPLAGAPAVRKLRLRRQSRFEIAPLASFTLLDPYERTILFGARLNYNFTDWLGIGLYGAFGAVKVTTALTDHIQEVNVARRQLAGDTYPTTTTGRLTKVNLGTNFKNQIGEINWIFAPQLTVVPFRGKIALFQSVYLDTDLYFFGGPAFVNVQERKNCGVNACNENTFARAPRTAFTATFGLGLSFYVNKWSSLGVDWRALPFSWNTGGFDTAGGGKDQKFPDDQISSADQRFVFNQMMSVSYSFYLPTQFRISE
jgi:outer membrane beta-barrel protein